jgi:hypothetical protein
MFRSQYALLAKKLLQMEEVVDKAKRENERLKREVQSKVGPFETDPLPHWCSAVPPRAISPHVHAWEAAPSPSPAVCPRLLHNSPRPPVAPRAPSPAPTTVYEP